MSTVVQAGAVPPQGVAEPVSASSPLPDTESTQATQDTQATQGTQDAPVVEGVAAVDGAAAAADVAADGLASDERKEAAPQDVNVSIAPAPVHEPTATAKKESKVQFATPPTCVMWDGRNADEYVESLLRASKKQSFAGLVLQVFEMCSNASTQKKRNVLNQCPTVLEKMTKRKYGVDTEHARAMTTMSRSLSDILSANSTNTQHWCVFVAQLVKIMSMERKMKGEEKKLMAKAMLRHATKMIGLRGEPKLLVNFMLDEIIDSHMFGKQLGKWKSISWVRKLFCACILHNMQK